MAHAAFFPTFRKLLPLLRPVSIIWRALPGRWATRAESAAVARLLAACRETGAAPGALLDAWAQDSRGSQGRRVVRAARLLRLGTPLAGVVESVPGLVQDDHAVAVRYGEQLGLVGPVVRATLAAEGPAEAEARRRTRAAVFFLGGTLLVFLLVAMFIATKIVPQFDAILRDFDAPRPATLTRWKAAAEVAARFARILPVLAVLGVVYLFSPAVRRLVTAPFTRWRRVALAIDALAVATAAGRPLPEAAAALAASQIDGRVAARLWRAAAAGPMGERLAAAGLVSAAEGRLVDAAGGDEAAVLRQIADRRREAGRRRGTCWRSLVMPLAVACLAAVTLATALAIFGPLVDLIDTLAEVRP
jgi:type II secretory pathway component PulF